MEAKLIFFFLERSVQLIISWMEGFFFLEKNEQYQEQKQFLSRPYMKCSEKM